MLLWASVDRGKDLNTAPKTTKETKTMNAKTSPAAPAATQTAPDLIDSQSIKTAASAESIISICQRLHAEACGILAKKRRMKKNMQRLENIAFDLEEANSRLYDMGYTQDVILKSGDSEDILAMFHTDCSDFVAEWEIDRGTYYFDN